MGEYQDYKEKKPPEHNESGCNVFVTVICGDEKKNDKKDYYGKGYPGSPCETEEDKKKQAEGCNVYITVICDGCDKKKDRA